MWDTRDADGESVPSGVYVCALRVEAAIVKRRGDHSRIPRGLAPGEGWVWTMATVWNRVSASALSSALDPFKRFWAEP